MPKLRPQAAKVVHLAKTVAQIEWLPLALLFVVALAVWGFVELADEVRDGNLETFDRTVLMAMREPGDTNDPLGPRWFEEAMRDITSLGSFAVLTALTVASCGYLWLEGKHSAVIYVFVAVLGALVISLALKSAYDRPRPDLFPHGDKVYTTSFPSGHSTMSAATFLTLGAMLAKYQEKKSVRIYFIAIAILLTLGVGVSRIYLSVHWPTDVRAGWTIGSAWALACWGVAAYLQRRGLIEERLIK